MSNKESAADMSRDDRVSGDEPMTEAQARAA
jgi:hypothetical protein